MLAAIVFLAIAATSIAFSQAAPWALFGLAVAGLVERGAPSLARTAQQMIWPLAGIAALSLLATLSGLWAPKPAAAVVKGFSLACVAAAAVTASGFLASPRPDRRAALANGIGIGLALGLLFVAINALTEDYLTRWAIWQVPKLANIGAGKHIRLGTDFVTSVSDSTGNRPMAVATLLAIPGWMVARRHTAPAIGWFYLVALGFFGVAVLAAGNHQSSQLALLCGALTYGLARLSLPNTVRLIAVTWCAATLAMPVLASTLIRTDTHNASWLFDFARARIIIWGETAKKIGQRPLLGHGVAATETIQKETPKPEWRPNEIYPRSTARHAHNAYLQIWFELGGAGGLLLCAFGLAVLDRVRRISPADQQLALAALAVVAGMIATSYGIWQLWLQASIAMAAVLSMAAMSQQPVTSPPR